MNTKNIFVRSGDYLALGLMFLASVILRGLSNFSSELPCGIDGMYYPLQVRHFMETGALGFQDMPLTFWIEALAAKIILICTTLSADESVILACKLTNVILPSLIVVPVFYLIRSLIENRSFSFFILVLLAFSVLNPTILVLLGVDFHKNAFGILFLYSTLYFFRSYLINSKVYFLMLSALFALMTVLTHFGCFSALLIFFILLIMVFAIDYMRNLTKTGRIQRESRTVLWVTGLIVVALPLLVFYFDTQRFEHMSNVLGNFLLSLKNSVLVVLVKGEPFLSGPRLAFFVILNILSILSVVVYFRIRKCLTKNERKILLVIVLWYICLTSPLLPRDIYERLLFIALVPLSIILIYALYHLPRKTAMTTAVVFSLFILLTVATLPKRYPVLSVQQLNELSDLSRFIKHPAKTIIITQHGLEWWTAWTLRTKVGLPSGLKQTEIPNYADVFFLIPSKEQDISIPKSSSLISNGQYFSLYKISQSIPKEEEQLVSN
ncbi:hypothetical protein [Parabacteroides sp. FAFU027]|uniref:hypothetical protein n=1 Tax=Parabacteroides sp. FAFU027 TaxID=2922715 RepID=UPI001FAFE92F|nr:hypothetical protein [Parabacteroides sp. FAFU027]